jgi:hypothetical protein
VAKTPSSGMILDEKKDFLPPKNIEKSTFLEKSQKI